MKITVVIPTFNSEKTVLRALKSVFAQTFPVHEVIVIDDGSSDNTVSIIRSEYADRVTVIRLEQNTGPGAARNAGIQEATGDWIAFLDADDQWLPRKTQNQKELLQRFPHLVWCAARCHIQKEGVPASSVVMNKRDDVAAEMVQFDNYFLAILRGHCDVMTPSVMIKKSVFEQVGQFDEKLLRHQDWDMWWRIAHHYKAIGYVTTPQIIVYLLFDDQIVNQRRLEAKKGALLSALIERHLAIAEKENSLTAFGPFAGRYIRNALLSMLFIGLTTEAKTMMEKFPALLTCCQSLFFKAMLLTAPLSLPLFRASVWIGEKCGIIKMSHRNWDYWKAYRQTRSQE